MPRPCTTRLTAGGFEPLSAPVLLPDDGSDWSGGRVFYVRDPDGVTIEIVERAAEQVVPVPAVVDAIKAVHRR